MPITRQYDVPIGMMVGAAMQAGAAVGEAERVKEGRQARLARERLAAQMSMQSQQLRARRAEALLQAAQRQGEMAQRQQMFGAELESREWTARMQADERHLEEIEQQIAAGTLKRPGWVTQKLLNLDTQEAEGQVNPDLGLRDRINHQRMIADQRRALRRIVVPAEQPPTIMSPDGQTEMKAGQGWKDDDWGIYSAQPGPEGLELRMHVDPSKMPANLKREFDFKVIEWRQEQAEKKEAQKRQAAQDDRTAQINQWDTFYTYKTSYEAANAAGRKAVLDARKALYVAWGKADELGKVPDTETLKARVEAAVPDYVPSLAPPVEPPFPRPGWQDPGQAPVAPPSPPPQPELPPRHVWEGKEDGSIITGDQTGQQWVMQNGVPVPK